MNDTTPRAAALYQAMLLARTPEQRMQMASSAFDSARAIVLASIRAQFPSLDEREVRVQLFLRTYGPDLPRRRVEQVVEQIRRRAPGATPSP